MRGKGCRAEWGDDVICLRPGVLVVVLVAVLAGCRTVSLPVERASDSIGDPVTGERRAALSAVAALADLPLPPTRDAWPEVRRTLEQGEAALAAVAEEGEPGDELRARMAVVRGAARESLLVELADASPAETWLILEQAPVAPDTAEPAWADRLRRTFAASSPDELRAFLGTTADTGRLEDVRRLVAGHLVEARLREGGSGAPPLARLLSALGEVAALGAAPDALPETRIAFVDATSRSLLRGGAIEFRVGVDIDLPVEAEKSDLDVVLRGEGADFVILFDVALARATRDFYRNERVASERQVGTRSVPNPSYQQAVLAVQQAQSEASAQRIRNSLGSVTCYGLSCLTATLAGIVGEDVARKRIEEAQATLAETPMTLNEPVYQPYFFNLTAINAIKTATVNYYVVDRRAGRYFKDTFDVIEDRRFLVSYGVDLHDPDRDAALSEADTEGEVDAWEKAPVTVPLSAIAEHYVENADRSRPLASVATLQASLASDRGAAAARHRREAPDPPRPSRHDPRFESVVVVYNPKGGAGTGFFVASDVVMTNWHVIEDATYVEMKLHDGRESFGKVMAYDVRLDLALVRIQTRGAPVRWHEGDGPAPGDTTDAIGHPRGQEFTLTRGIVSAIRRAPNINVAGGRDVLYVQTDAAVNPGNSGGPLFLGDRVVAVNTFGRRDATNINFSVHHTEARRFLAEHLPSS